MDVFFTNGFCFLSLLWVFLVVFGDSFCMGSIRAVSFNVNGGRDKNKRAVVYGLCRQKNLNVILLQETHSDSNNEIEWGMEWQGEKVLSHGTNLSAGVAILFAVGLDVRIKSIVENENGRALAVETDFEGVGYIFINVYAPNKGAERVELFDKVKQAIQHLDRNSYIVLGGIGTVLRIL